MRLVLVLRHGRGVLSLVQVIVTRGRDHTVRLTRKKLPTGR